jgi:hypothetical protein
VRRTPAAAVQADGFERRLRGVRDVVSLFNPDQLIYLQRTAELCRTEAVRCVYVHGNYARRLVRRRSANPRAAQRGVRSAGLVLASEGLICIEPEDLGDTIRHVRPEQRRRYTDRLFSIVAGAHPAIAEDGCLDLRSFASSSP